MHKLCRVDLERSQELLKRLDKYIKTVIKALNPEKIILFGSFARKDFNEGSDIDLIVVNDWEENFLDRIGILLELNNLGLPLEPIGYTKDEIEMMIKDENPFITQVLIEGITMYERG
jgi:predicted nucleotidyltransferase